MLMRIVIAIKFSLQIVFSENFQLRKIGQLSLINSLSVMITHMRKSAQQIFKHFQMTSSQRLSDKEANKHILELLDDRWRRQEKLNIEEKLAQRNKNRMKILEWNSIN